MLSRPGRTQRLLLLSLTCLALFAAPAVAQRSYKADEIDTRIASRGAIVRRFMATGEGDRQLFENYFTRYYFPAMTQPTPEGLGALEKLNGDLFKNFLHKGSGATQKWLSDKALAFGKRVSADRGYHPAVRLNAVLLVGRIDDKYDADKPQPSADANDYLCKIAAAGATREGVPHYLLTGALTGLERHTRSFTELPRPRRGATAGALYRVVNTDELAGEYADGVRDWVYLQAADAIANLGTAGPRGGLFAAAVAKRAADESLSLDTRIELAGLLAKMRGKAPGGVLLKAIAPLASEVAEREAEVADKFEQRQLRGGGRGYGRTTGPASRDTTEKRRFRENEERQLLLVREELVRVLVGLQAGVRATAAANEGEAAAAMKTVDDAIAPVLQAAGNDDEIDLAVTDAVKAMADQIVAAVEPYLPKEEAEPEQEAEPEAADVAAASPE